MKEMYIKSLRKIKELNIKTEKEYIVIIEKEFVLLLPSLKYISGTDYFDEIVELAKQVA